MKINIKIKEEMELRDFLKTKGLKLTTQRKKIIEYFFNKNKHVSTEELYEEVKKIVPGVGYATVHRTLNLLASAGLATKRHFENNITLFEPIYKKEHHDHMICISCGKIIEFENYKMEKLQEGVAKEHNFRTISHRLELYGYCEKCNRKRKARREK